MKRIVDDLVLESAEAATLLTYRDTKTIIEGLTKAKTSKHRIHGYVQRAGSYMDRERRKLFMKAVRNVAPTGMNNNR